MNLLQLFKNENDPIQFAPGETVFCEGDPGDYLFIVLDGEIELQVGELPVDVISAGEMVGEMALIDARPRSATAVAKSPARLVAIDENRFNFLVQQTPNFALVVMRTLVGRLREMDKTIGDR